MKKTIALTLSIVMIATLLLAFTACGGADAIKGTWEISDEYSSISYTFAENNKFTMKISFASFDEEPEVEVISGTYKVAGSKLTITAEEDGETESTEYNFEVKGDTLKLTSVDYPDDSQELTKK